MLQKYSESDFEIFSLDLSRFSFLKRFSKKKSSYTLNFFIHAFFFFHFCNILNLDNFNIERFFLIIWIFTGSFGLISKFKSRLSLGKYYYNFIVKYILNKRNFLNILSFILDDFLKDQYNDAIYFNSECYFLIFNNLNLFTNIKLAKGVYFYRVKQKLFIYIKLIKQFLKFFLFYLNSLKLYNKFFSYVF